MRVVLNVRNDQESPAVRDIRKRAFWATEKEGYLVADTEEFVRLHIQYQREAIAKQYPREWEAGYTFDTHLIPGLKWSFSKNSFGEVDEVELGRQALELIRRGVKVAAPSVSVQLIPAEPQQITVTLPPEADTEVIHHRDNGGRLTHSTKRRVSDD
jgi:hypothetical protein